jgi:hypothetical protein
LSGWTEVVDSLAVDDSCGQEIWLLFFASVLAVLMESERTAERHFIFVLAWQKGGWRVVKAIGTERARKWKNVGCCCSSHLVAAQQLLGGIDIWCSALISIRLVGGEVFGREARPRAAAGANQ